MGAADQRSRIDVLILDLRMKPIGYSTGTSVVVELVEIEVDDVLVDVKDVLVLDVDVVVGGAVVVEVLTDVLVLDVDVL